MELSLQFFLHDFNKVVAPTSVLIKKSKLLYLFLDVFKVVNLIFNLLVPVGLSPHQTPCITKPPTWLVN